jgi:very-short-patch-repair endonuclease
MNSVYFDVRKRGGVAATHELLRDGHTSHRLTAAVRRGEVIRARQGHYVCPEMAESRIRAVRVGGRLTGLSLARELAVWTPRTNELEVAVHPDARALRTSTDARVRLAEQAQPTTSVRWSDTSHRGTRDSVGPRDMLQDVARRHPPIVAFAVAESALVRGILSSAELLRVIATLPPARRGLLAHASRASESGGESLTKFRLVRMRIPFAQQIEIEGAGRVDFLIGERLVIEIDGAEFHTSREAFEEDRRRDAVLVSAGYRVLRFSYAQVERRWTEVSGSIRASLERRDHRWGT